ncbi:MAG TPA: MGMT family protein [Patescibacteria group bacterium]
MDNLFQKVHEIVTKVPKGKVTTYGEIAKSLGTKDVRKIGWALHANKDLSVPCHRVVNKDGRLAPGYAFGGPDMQKEKLLKEGVLFKDQMHVDLKKCMINL